MLGFILLFVPGGIFADIFLAFMWYVCSKNNQYRDVVEEKKRCEQLGFIEQVKRNEAWLEENKYKWWRFGAWKKETVQKSIFTTKEDCVEVDCSPYGLNTTLIYPLPFHNNTTNRGERKLVDGSCIENYVLYYDCLGNGELKKYMVESFEEAKKITDEMFESFLFWGFGPVPFAARALKIDPKNEWVTGYLNETKYDVNKCNRYSTKNGTEYGAYQLMMYALQNKRSELQMRASDIIKKEPYLYYKHFIDNLMQKEQEQTEKVRQVEQVMA